MSGVADRSMVHANARRIVEEVGECCVAANRNPDSVEVVAVTKYVDAETTRWVAEAGLRNLGENRVQSWLPKIDAEGLSDVHWHMIGHLQRNKVRRILPHVTMVHSVDSSRLLMAIDRIASEINADHESSKLSTELLIEVNISGDGNKTGLAIDDVIPLFEQWCESQRSNEVQVVGLMAMASQAAEASRRTQFSNLRTMRDDLSVRFGIELPVLSMGMSGDFAEAIAEGATHVRIGSRFFAAS